MQDVTDFLERALQALLLPASVYGAAGALMHSARKGRTLPHTLFEVVGGLVAANMLGPVVQKNTPEEWWYTLFFLVGWGGMELVSRLYEAAVQALEGRIRKRINPPE